VTAGLGLAGAPLIALELIALVAGVGITALGPGGVLVPIGLVALTSLSPGQIAGTAIVTHVGTGVLGSVVYARSGQLRERVTSRTATILATAAALGTPVGVLLNALVGRGLFSALLGAFVVLVGLLVWTRTRSNANRPEPAPDRGPDPRLTAAIGFVVAVISGLFGLGGPLLCVPLLIIARLPILSALAAAQAQSVVIAATGSVGYLLRGTISWPLALAITLPELAGVLIGWKIAHNVPTKSLTRTLALVLIALGPYLALR
jgi:hypothetical protein